MADAGCSGDSALLLRRLVDWAGELEELARMPGGERALAPLLVYVANVSPDLQLEQFRAIPKGRAPAAESITMTIAEQLLAEGEARGQAKGRTKGRTEGKAEALLVILHSRALPVAEAAKHRIESCTDAATLDLWLSRAVTVETVEALFEL